MSNGAKNQNHNCNHKDRFIRFGYDWFEKFCMKFNTTIMVVNNEALSPQEELVQDIVFNTPCVFL